MVGDRRNPRARIVWNVLQLLALALWAVVLLGSQGYLYSWMMSPATLGVSEWNFLAPPLVAVAVLVAGMMYLRNDLEPVKLLILVSVVWLLLAIAMIALGAFPLTSATMVLAAVLTAGFPVVSAGVMILLTRRKQVRIPFQIAAAGTIGVAAALALPYAGVILGCAVGRVCP